MNTWNIIAEQSPRSSDWLLRETPEKGLIARSNSVAGFK